MCLRIAMLIVRAHASEAALIEIIVAIKDTSQKGSGEIAPLIKPSDLIILNPGSTGGSLFFVQIFCAFGLDDLPVDWYIDSFGGKDMLQAMEGGRSPKRNK